MADEALEHLPSNRESKLEQQFGFTWCKRCGRVLVKDRDPDFVQTKPCKVVHIVLRCYEKDGLIDGA
jgi:hypothetical protein